MGAQASHHASEVDTLVAEVHRWRSVAEGLQALADELPDHLDTVVDGWLPDAFRGGPARRAHLALQHHRAQVALAAARLGDDADRARARAAMLQDELDALLVGATHAPTG